MHNQSQDVLEAVKRLVEVVAKLRSPDGGCPWDLAQTPQTLIPYVIEEAYEVADALRTHDQDLIKGELGDLLLQVVLQAQIATEKGDFTLEDVAKGITDKLIRRHPHVFGNEAVAGVEEVKANWEKIKAQEITDKGVNSNLLSYQLSNYARTLPPLMACSKISRKAAKAGLEWESVQGVWDKFHEELAELQEALATEDKEHQQAELGDLLFTIVNIARWYGLDSYEALQGTNDRFIQRLAKVESIAHKPLHEYTLDELETLWQQAKKNIAAKNNL